MADQHTAGVGNDVQLLTCSIRSTSGTRLAGTTASSMGSASQQAGRTTGAWTLQGAAVSSVCVAGPMICSLADLPCIAMTQQLLIDALKYERAEHL